MKKVFVMMFLVLSVALGAAERVKMPVVFYLRNLPMERIGSHSDEKIRSDLQSQGFIVIDVDCSSFPKTSPALEDALVKFHINCKQVYGGLEDETRMVDVSNIFYVPEGYTVTRHIPVWNIEKHGADGSMEWVMDTWNSHIVSRKGQSPVTSPDQMYNPDGSPIDWNLYMDIVHPSGKAAAKVPLVLNYGTVDPPMSSFRHDRPAERVYRNIYLLGFLTTGYAFAITDHCFNPLAKGTSWGHFKQYTLDDYNGLAASTAFIRYLRSHLDEYNLNGKIGVMGISKASYSVLRVADPDNACREESMYLHGRPNTKEQPWNDAGSHVDVGYAAAGVGTERMFRYLEDSSVPLITSAGQLDEYNQWEAYEDVVRYLDASDHIHLSLWMEDLGHTYPCLGVDGATGIGRYELFKKFFDHYLKPSVKTSADVFYVLPKEGATGVDQYGRSRVLPEDRKLPGQRPWFMYPYAIAGLECTYQFAESYPGMVIRHNTGEGKYVIFKKFYDAYMTGSGCGKTSVLASDRIFQYESEGVAVDAPVTVRFLEAYPVDEIASKVRVVSVSDGSRIRGKWASSMKGTCFTFCPDVPMKPGEKYRIVVPDSIVSLCGNRPSKAFVRDFVIAKQID